MRKIFIALSAVLLLAGCGHNVSQLELGKLVSIGSPEYGKAKYMEGMAATLVGKENTRISISVDSTVGISLDPATNTLKGIQEITVETGPQLTGYSKDATDATTKQYFAAVKEYYKCRQPAPIVSSEKSQQATTSISSVVKAAIASLYKKTSGEDPFDCPDGNCEFRNCREHADIAWQAAAANKLMTYSPRTDNADPDTGKESDYDNLVSFIARMAKLSAEGKTNTKVRIDSFTIKDSKLTAISFGYTRDDGTWEEVVCVSCLAFDD